MASCAAPETVPFAWTRSARSTRRPVRAERAGIAPADATPTRRLERYRSPRECAAHAIGIAPTPTTYPQKFVHFALHRSTSSPWNGTSRTNGTENAPSRMAICAGVAWREKDASAHSAPK